MRDILLHEVVFGLDDAETQLEPEELQGAWERVPRFLREAFQGISPVTLAWAGEHWDCESGRRVVLVRVGFWTIESEDRDREVRDDVCDGD